MSTFGRAALIIAVAFWSLGTLGPRLGCMWHSCPSDGLSVTYDGVVDGVDDGSSAAKAGILVGDRLVPLPRGLDRDPPPARSFDLARGRIVRHVVLTPAPVNMTPTDKLRLLALALSYLIFVVVGSALLWLRPSAMTWSFYLYCILRRYGDLYFYWPGSDDFFWFNFLAFVSLGGAGCALVTMFALRFPDNKLEGWRRTLDRISFVLALLLPLAWLYCFTRFNFLALPSQPIFRALVIATSVVYLAAAGIFLVTLFQSHGEERQRREWILVFPAVLLLRIAVINFNDYMPGWMFDALIALGVLVPLTVAYAVIRRRVFDVQFAISRALAYASLTTLIAGTFLLLDWFMSKQFAQSRFTLTAEVIIALALGSSLNMLHRNVDRFVDVVFFRQRHFAERRLAKAAVAVGRAESFSVVDQFLVHEPLQALELVSAALFRKSEHGSFARTVDVGWESAGIRELGPNDPLVLHLLGEGAPVRLAEVAWSDDRAAHMAHAVLAMPLLLRDQIVAIAFYGPHRTGADIDPDEQRSLTPLLDRAGAAYDHIDAQALRAKVELLTRERDETQREITRLRAEMK